MRRVVNCSVMGAILAAVFVLAGCQSLATIGSVESLPNDPALAKELAGMWTNDPNSGFSVCAFFYEDGMVEIFSKMGLVEKREVAQIRVTSTTWAIRNLKGVSFVAGVTRPIKLSADKRQIFFPEVKAGGVLLALLNAKMVADTWTKIIPPAKPPVTLVPDLDPIPDPKPTISIDNAGTPFYSYDGTGYVYMDNSVFYLCSDGKPAGYVEGGVIYAFAGKALGFYDDQKFIYDLKGNPKGALNPKNLGKDAEKPKKVSKAAKQALPTKGAKTPVTKPPLRNGYFGGTLADIF